MSFLELIEEEMAALDEEYDYIDMLEDMYADNPEMMKEDIGFSDELYDEIVENFTRSVSSKGVITKKKPRKIRSRRATVTKKMSKSQLKQIAKRAARTKKRNPSSMRKAIKKQRKGMKRRKSLRIKRGS